MNKLDEVMKELDELFDEKHMEYVKHHEKDFGIRSRQVVALVDYLIKIGVIKRS